MFQLRIPSDQQKKASHQADPDETVTCIHTHVHLIVQIHDTPLAQASAPDAAKGAEYLIASSADIEWCESTDALDEKYQTRTSIQSQKPAQQGTLAPLCWHLRLLSLMTKIQPQLAGPPWLPSAMAYLRPGPHSTVEPFRLQDL